MTRKASSACMAEETAHDGETESQDSQLIMEQYHRELGVGALSSSPVPLDKLRRVHEQSKFISNSFHGLNTQQEKAESGRLGASTPEHSKPLNDAPGATSRPQCPHGPQGVSTRPRSLQQRPRTSSSLPRSLSAWEPQEKHIILAARQHGHTAAAEAPSPVVRNDVPPHILRSTVLPAKLRRRRMMMMDDFMSESPTQSNEGRSYEQYAELHTDRGFTSQNATEQDPIHIDRDTQESGVGSSHEHRTLHEDDTGAVNFNWHPPEQEDYGVNDEHRIDPPVSTSQPATKSQPDVTAALERHSMPPPETPIVSSRPFARSDLESNVMGATQLFMQTQFTSGVKKVASPTSSRPSPHVFEHNTISPNNLSSPLKNRGLRTSPIHEYATSPVYPVPNTSSKSEREPQDETETIPGSPVGAQPRFRSRPDPIGEYTPIRKSTTPEAEVVDLAGNESDSESDKSQKRRRLAKLKQERANRSLTNIALPRRISGGGDHVEVPSTNRRKQHNTTQSTASALSSPADYLRQRHPKADITDDGDETQETVADSQELATEVKVLSRATCEVERVDQQPVLTGDPVRSNETAGSKETIPETSPPGKRRSQANTIILTEAEAEPTRRLRSTYRMPSQSVRPSSDESKALPSSPPIPIPVPASSQEACRSTRTRATTTPNPPTSQALGDQPATTSSTLTVLSETPQVSSSTTPDTGSANKDNAKNTSSPPAVASTLVSSPAAAKKLRNRTSKLRTYASPRESVRSTRSMRRGSISTDELAPSTPVSVTKGRSSRSFVRKSISNTDLRVPTASDSIFHGMTFAISFHSDKDKKEVEKLITGGGGTILPGGFVELIDVGSLGSDQKPGLKSGQTAGFAALITDTHSRKPKYMQALALGLPCLSWKWVSSCVKAGNIVDWSTYLLCAGQSQILSAIRSRSLEPYDARNANIEEVIDRRPRLLKDVKVLLVMKKSKKEEEKRMQYVFLAQVLGASLVRVGTLEEARVELKTREAANDSFDWVYVDGLSLDAEKVLFGHAQPLARKRKRQSAESFDDPPPKRVKTMTDELIVQSLILGRLLEDGEMEDMMA